MSVPCAAAPMPAATAARGPAGGAAGRQPRIMRVQRRTVQTVAGEPAQREGRRVGPPEDQRPGAGEVGHDGAVALGDQILLQGEAVGRRAPGHVDIDLDGDGHAGQRAGIVAGGDARIHPVGGGEGDLRRRVDHRVDRGVDGVEPGERARGDLARADLARAQQGGDGGGGQAPELGHGISISRRPRRVRNRGRARRAGRRRGS